MSMSIACQDHLLSSSICRWCFFVAMSLIWICFSARYKYIMKEGKNNLLFLLVTSYVEPSFSFAGSKPCDPSTGWLCLKTTTYLFVFPVANTLRAFRWCQSWAIWSSDYWNSFLAVPQIKFRALLASPDVFWIRALNAGNRTTKLPSPPGRLYP